jgi:hypothetical protein
MGDRSGKAKEEDQIYNTCKKRRQKRSWSWYLSGLIQRALRILQKLVLPRKVV